MAARRILMGVVGRPHGVRGLVRVHSYADEDLASFAPLFDERGQAWTLTWRAEGVAELRDAQGTPLPDRTAAERLTNARLFIDREQLPETVGDEFYLADLVGLQAVSVDGQALGQVVQVHDYGAGASLELTGGMLVPFTHASVPAVDVLGGRVTIDPPVEVEAAGTLGDRLPLPSGEGRGEGAPDAGRGAQP